MAEKKPLVKRRKEMAKKTEDIVGGSDSDAARSMGALIREYDYAIDNNEWVSAGEKLDRMQALVDQHSGPAGDDNSEPATPEKDDPSTETNPTESPRAKQEEPPATGGDDGNAEDPLKRFKDKFKSLETEIDALKNDPENVMHRGLMETLKNYEWIIEEGDPDKVSDSLRRIEGILADYEGLMVQKRPLEARRKDMERGIEEILSGDNSDAARTMGASQREFDYALANNEWVSAAEKLDRMKNLIDEFGTAQVEEEEEEIQASEQPDAPATDDPIEVDVDPAAVKAEIDDMEGKRLKARLDQNKKEINSILKNKESENAKLIVQAMTSYTAAIKNGKFGVADIALDDVEDVLEKAKKEFSLTDKQREAIMKELEKMEAEIDDLASELAE